MAVRQLVDGVVLASVLVVGYCCVSSGVVKTLAAKAFSVGFSLIFSAEN